MTPTRTSNCVPVSSLDLAWATTLPNPQAGSFIGLVCLQYFYIFIFLKHIFWPFLLGIARGERDKYIAWILAKDTDTLIQITEAGKSPTCLSEMACQAVQRQGLTEMTLVDHTLTQRVQDCVLFRFSF